jgi:threonine dehydratase
VVTLQDIEAAHRRIAGAVYRSPCAKSDHFTDLVGVSELYSKLENLQRTVPSKSAGR